MRADQRDREIEALRGRLSRLSEASRHINESLDVDTALHRVTLAGKPLDLTATEYAVLYELAVHATRTLTHAVRLQQIWRPEKVGEPWLVRDMVRRLRRKLRDDADPPNRAPRRLPHGEGRAGGRGMTLPGKVRACLASAPP